MNRKLLAELVSRRTGVSYPQAERIVCEVFNVIAESIQGGLNVSIRGFGTFKMVERRPRRMIGKGGTAHMTAHAMVPKFKPSRTTRKRIQS